VPRSLPATGALASRYKNCVVRPEQGWTHLQDARIPLPSKQYRGHSEKRVTKEQLKDFDKKKCGQQPICVLLA